MNAAQLFFYALYALLVIIALYILVTEIKNSE